MDKVKTSSTKRQNGEERGFEPGMVAGARQAGVNVSEAAVLLGFSPSTRSKTAHSDEFSVPQWPPHPPDIIPREHLWDVVELGDLPHR